jgi:hypothetical protein
MADVYDTTNLSDDVFEQYIKSQLTKKSVGTTVFTDPIKDNTWVGLNQGEYTIVRIVSAPPPLPGSTLKPSPFDVHEVIKAEVKDDQGKWFPIIYPVMTNDLDHSHIMHRFISKVLEVEWSKTVKGDKSFKNKSKYPELVDKLEHGGWSTTDRQRQYSPGFKGKKMAIMNVIDRLDMEWHRTNKKMKLLSKAVTVGKDGVSEFITMGVPSFGFLKAFEDVLQTSGNWSKYDVGIKKTGEQSTPYVIKNASKYKKGGMLEELKGVKGIPDGSIISVDDFLTEEELSWKLVDIENEFKPTSYFMLKRRLGSLFDECDRCLGTRFCDELGVLIEAEQKHWELENPKTEETITEITTTSSPIEESVTSTPRVVRRETVSAQAGTTLSEEQVKVLKGFGLLTDQEKSWIKDVVLKADGTLDHIIYDSEAGALTVCPDPCKEEVPYKFSTCPVCGVEYADE